ncbi:ogr/Delta-like zinc finger family protein, partial [Salmonella enterica subsp. enterica serovar Cerro]|nr:ogr/Delta-like zinc finger family protein [Salmonella enterica subsp. enterica serovar Cerro]
GDVEFYLPEGRWTHLWRNDEVQGSRWHKQQHDFLSLPVYVRDMAAHTRSSFQVSSETKERYNQCTNIECGHTFVTHETFVRSVCR